jgi:formate dehydrogenase beta subunit
MRNILNEHKMLNSDCVDIPVKLEYRVHTLKNWIPKSRKHMFEEVERTISQEEAYREATRCMRCYRIYSVITSSPFPKEQRNHGYQPSSRRTLRARQSNDQRQAGHRRSQ